MTKKSTGRPTKEEQAADLEKGENLVKAINPFPLVNDEFSGEGLTDQQRVIARLKMRGLTQHQIGTYLQISQPAVSKHLARVKEYMKEKGSKVDQSVIVGETTSVYEEIEAKSWEIFSATTDHGDKIKAMQLVMLARDKQTKLLMDLGHLERAGTRTTVDVNVSPLVKSWQRGEAIAAVNTIIQSQLKELEAPRPPEEIEDAEFTEIEDD